jgi:predicted membrane-bound mannosyltransferase
MFIHEALLAVFGISVLFSLVTGARRGLPGFLLGLMFATKETFAISVIAWTGAAALLAFENRRSINRAALIAWLRPAAISLLAFFLTAAFFYTDAFRHPHGAADAVRTFFVYETVEGHDKPFGWYFQFLVLPRKSAGLWWFGTPLVLLALWAFAATFRKTDKPDPSRPVVRFLAYSAAGHFLIYSFIAYKTPWLAFLPWAHVCLLAGFSLKEILKQGVIAKVALTALAGLCLVTQFRQARFASGRLASDGRNPYAYVPTRGEVEKLESWLGELRAVMPAGALESVAVVGSDYWPLPWYLRSFEKTGYWSEPPPDLAAFPLVLAMPDAADAVKHSLEATHVELPRGLRDNVPVVLHLRNEVWERWMKTEDR